MKYLMSSEAKEIKVGKKGAIYLPSKIREKLGVKEGDKALIKVEGDKIVIEFIPDPFSMALRVRKWAETTVEEFERESEEEQGALY